MQSHDRDTKNTHAQPSKGMGHLKHLLKHQRLKCLAKQSLDDAALANQNLGIGAQNMVLNKSQSVRSS